VAGRAEALACLSTAELPNGLKNVTDGATFFDREQSEVSTEAFRCWRIRVATLSAGLFVVRLGSAKIHLSRV
jgi:hypothetical protein